MPARELRAYAHAMIHTAAFWDVMGAAGALPSWWPPISYVLIGAGAAAACVSVLIVTLTTRRRVATAAGAGDTVAGTAGGAAATAGPASAAGTPPSAAAPRAPATDRRGGSAGQLLAIGILLVGWLLRGHAEIPPDTPIVAAQVAAATLYAYFTIRRKQARSH